ncbi:MAG: type III-A CRISPR-associated RAMP protein Csm5 [Deltaproteobacteria bacterium]|nr:type III-A CRISPR-associated RAMP protein Csm5 [Deltaproteobacteria bacterium]
MDKNKKIYCSLKIITPVHIGSGEDYYLTDYYFSGQKKELIFFNKTAISKLIFAEGEGKFKKFISASEKGEYLKIKSLMEKHIEIAKTGEVSVTDDLMENFRAKTTGIDNHPISKHIKEAFNMLPYIPGSTLKGVIRTAFNYEFLKENSKSWAQKLRRENFNCDFINTEQKDAMQNDPFRCIKVSDFMFVKGKTIIDKPLNLTKKGENPIPNMLELCVEETLFYGEIDLSLIDKLETDANTEFAKLVKKYFQNNLNKERIEKILKEYYEKLFAKEKKEFADKNVESIKDLNRRGNYRKWHKKGLDFNQNNECYIKLGKHGGAISKTTAGGDDHFREYRKVKIPQLDEILDCQLTNWISSLGKPLGWAKIKFLTKEEAEALKKEREEFITAQKKETEDRIKRNEEAKKSAMEKKRLKEEKLANMSDQAKMICSFINERYSGQKQQKEYEIYSFLLDDKVDKADKIEAAKALKDYYEQEGIWDKRLKKSNKRRGRINKVKEILEIEA